MKEYMVLREVKDVLFLTTHLKKSHFNLSSLASALGSNIRLVHNNLTCHLVTSPYIAVVVVVEGVNPELLATHKVQIFETVQSTLWDLKEK